MEEGCWVASLGDGEKASEGLLTVHVQPPRSKRFQRARGLGAQSRCSALIGFERMHVCSIAKGLEHEQRVALVGL